MCLQIDSREKKKKKATGKEQDGTKNSGTIFFCRRVVFYFCFGVLA